MDTISIFTPNCQPLIALRVVIDGPEKPMQTTQPQGTCAPRIGGIRVGIGIGIGIVIVGKRRHERSQIFIAFQNSLHPISLFVRTVADSQRSDDKVNN